MSSPSPGGSPVAGTETQPSPPAYPPLIILEPELAVASPAVQKARDETYRKAMVSSDVGVACYNVRSRRLVATNEAALRLLDLQGLANASPTTPALTSWEDQFAVSPNFLHEDTAKYVRNSRTSLMRIERAAAQGQIRYTQAVSSFNLLVLFDEQGLPFESITWGRLLQRGEVDIMYRPSPGTVSLPPPRTREAAALYLDGLKKEAQARKKKKTNPAAVAAGAEPNTMLIAPPPQPAVAAAVAAAAPSRQKWIAFDPEKKYHQHHHPHSQQQQQQHGQPQPPPPPQAQQHQQKTLPEP